MSPSPIWERAARFGLLMLLLACAPTQRSEWSDQGDATPQAEARWARLSAACDRWPACWNERSYCAVFKDQDQGELELYCRRRAVNCMVARKFERCLAEQAEWRNEKWRELARED